MDLSARMIRGAHQCGFPMIVPDGISRASQSANFSPSATAFLAPAGGAVGGALGFYTLSLVGYDPASSVNTTLATNGMLTAAIGLPMIAFIVSGILMLSYPITASRHAFIRKRIESRKK